MRDILQTIGGVLAIASMIFIDVLVMKSYISKDNNKEARKLFSYGIVLATTSGIVIFVLFNAISKLF